MTETLITNAARGGSLWMWCPGCEALHSATFANWSIDTEDLDRPTIEPSLLVTGGPNNVRCHSYVRNGTWEFLPDSTHALAGQTVPLPLLPEWFVNQDDPTPARVTLTDDDQANDCSHGSASGIDTTPVSDPAKVWRCDHCGLRWSDTSPLRYTAADLAAREAAVRAQIKAEILALTDGLYPHARGTYLLAARIAGGEQA